jgi:hypothetical protein
MISLKKTHKDSQGLEIIHRVMNLMTPMRLPSTEKKIPSNH